MFAWVWRRGPCHAGRWVSGGVVLGGLLFGLFGILRLARGFAFA